MRVGLMLYEQDDPKLDFILDLQHQLTEAGHTTHFTSKALRNLKMDVSLVAGIVEQETADAWVVHAGSREVLEWFAAQDLQVFAPAGRRRGLPIAGCGPDKPACSRGAHHRSRTSAGTAARWCGASSAGRPISATGGTTFARAPPRPSSWREQRSVPLPPRVDGATAAACRKLPEEQGPQMSKSVRKHHSTR
jgi:hypothetical protein